MGIRIGVAGTGAHAQHYIRLFNAHPLVDELVLRPARRVVNVGYESDQLVCKGIDILLRERGSHARVLELAVRGKFRLIAGVTQQAVD